MSVAAPITPEKPRLAFIDLAKGLCIMLVVWHHVVSTWGFPSYPGQLACSSFRMPLYFFLSGLFFKSYDGFFDFARRKTNKLLIPFVFFFITTSCLLAFVLAHFHLRANPGAGVWYSFVFEENFPNLPIWFLLSLFWANLLFYLLTLLSKNVLGRVFTRFGMVEKGGVVALAVLSLAMGLAGFLLGRFSTNVPMFLDTAMTSIPFFCMGHLAFRYTPLLKPNRFDKWNIPLALGGFAMTYWLADGPVFYVSNSFGLPVWRLYLCGLLGTLSIILLCKTLKHLPLVSYFGRYSIMILLTHGWVQWALIQVLQRNRVQLPVQLSLVLVFVVTMLLYLGIIPFMKRFMPHVTAQKDIF